MLFSFLIASVSTGSISITNRCINGAVDHEFLVTLKAPAANSNGRRLDTTEDKLSFLQGWVEQYTVDQHDPEGTTRRKLEANSTHVSNCTQILHFFTATQLAVAVGACDEVRRAPSSPPRHAPTSRAPVHPSTPPRRICTSLTATIHMCPHQTIARMADDPAVESIECDCLERVDMSLPQLPQGDDSFPGDPGALDLDEAVARRLTVHNGPPWGLDRIDGVDDNSYDDGDLGGQGVRVYVVDTGIQGSHVDFGGRVVNGHTVRAAPVAACKGSSRPCYPRFPAYQSTPYSTPPPQPLPLSFPPRSPSSATSAPRAKLPTASSPRTALAAAGTAPTWPRPSAA